MRDYVSSRPLCSLLPRFTALTRLSLSGYSPFIDVAPLGGLPHLAELSLESETLPKLEGLPHSLRRLQLCTFASTARWACAARCGHVLRPGAAAPPLLFLLPSPAGPAHTPALCTPPSSLRVSLPQHLRLQELDCSCPQQPVYLGLSRAMQLCRRIRVAAAAVHALLHLDAEEMAGMEAGPVETLAREFVCRGRCEELLLEAPAGCLRLVASVPQADRRHRVSRLLLPQAGSTAEADLVPGVGARMENMAPLSVGPLPWQRLVLTRTGL